VNRGAAHPPSDRATRAQGPGRPRGPRQRVRESTRGLLLDAALEIASADGVARVSMSDVSARAGVSRGTTYRHFGSVAALLGVLVRREAARFEQQVWQAMERVPDGEERLQVAFDYAARLARSHPALQRLPETDPALVLQSLRSRYPEIRASLSRLFAPLLARTHIVAAGIATTEQLVDWMTRLLVSTYLFPDPQLEDTAAALRGTYRLIAETSAGDENA
jgi:AcrR family transcriptional regulator